MRLRTLGGLGLEGSGFGRPKPLLLLAFLALEGQQERRFLAELFWRDAADPLNAVAKALTLLRRADPGCVEADRRHARTPVETDVGILLAHLRGDQLEEAVACYAGPFAAGADLQSLGGELEAWLLERREAIAAQVQHALLRLGEAAAARGRMAEAVAHAERAWRLPGADPSAPELLVPLHALLLAGDSPLARRVAEEAAALDLPLAPSASQARAEMRAGKQAACGPLPAATTSFVGRETELADLDRLLADDACRLLTVSGAGGSGKTRLAFELARRWRPLRAEVPVCAVTLDDVVRPEEAFRRLEAAFGLAPGAPYEHPHRRVAEHIGAGPLLLVLDGVDRLSDEADSLVPLLTSCPALTLLATSREPLGLQAEWVYRLAGLSLPARGSSAPYEDVRASPAARLFVQRARQTVPEFALTDTNATGIAEVCRLVGGSPLAIELAAAWTASMRCDELADALAADLDLLASNARDRADRHRSIRATFEHSWSRLAERERAVLSALGGFHGGFDREAAAEVAGASIRLLGALVDRSLVASLPEGRYELHPLVRGYAREKLAADPAHRRAVQERHAAHYLRLLGRHEEDLWGSGQEEALRRLGADMANLEAAWLAAPRSVPGDVARDAARAMQHLCELSGRLPLGVGVLDRAREAWQDDADTVAMVDALQPWLIMRLGRPAEASERARRALDAASPDRGDPQVLFALVTLGSCAHMQGDTEGARHWFEVLRDRSVESGEPRFMAPPLINLAEVEKAVGAYERAEHLNDEGLALVRRTEDAAHVASALAQKSRLARLRGHAHVAILSLEEALHGLGENGNAWYRSEVVLELAETHVALGEPDAAARHSHRALALARDAGFGWVAAGAHRLLSDLAGAAGEVAAAERHAREGVRVAWQAGERPSVLANLATLAAARAAAGDDTGARVLAQLVHEHPAAEHHVRAHVERAFHLQRRPAGEARKVPVAATEGTLAQVVEPLLTEVE